MLKQIIYCFENEIVLKLLVFGFFMIFFCMTKRRLLL